MLPIRDSVPRRFPPIVVTLLIGSNAAVFLYQVALPPPLQEWLVYRYGLVPARYSHPQWGLWHGLAPWDWLPFLTNQFLHGGWLHLVGNMWTLWIFGPALEDRLGGLRFLVFYLLCGIAAGLFHMVFNLDSTIPAIGASGAISGVLGGYALLFPLARVMILVPVLFIPFFFELPALVYALVWFWLQFLQGAQGLLAPAMGGGVAWWAHVGGFVTGLLLVRLFRLPARRRRGYFPDEAVLGFGTRGERR